MAEPYYKLTDASGSTHGGYKWSLPTADGPGAWHEIEGALVQCRNGLHVMSAGQIPLWANADERAVLWECEVDGEVVAESDQCVARRVRLTRRVGAFTARVLRLLACSFAERVLPLFEAEFPDDKRPREAIEVGRRFANGEATSEELAAASAAARAAALNVSLAAMAAAWATSDADAWVAYDAAWAAAWASSWADAWAAARAAARAAAWDAASAAARAAAWDAASAAERAWQGAEILRQLGATDAS